MSSVSKQPCLAPQRGYVVLMCKLNTTERIVCQSSQKLVGSFVHCGSGEEIREVTYAFKKPLTLYFIGSDKAVLNGWFYVLQWIVSEARYACSCVEGRDYNCCKHSAELEETATSMPECITSVA